MNNRMWITRNNIEGPFTLWFGKDQPNWDKKEEYWRSGHSDCSIVEYFYKSLWADADNILETAGPSAIVEVKLTQVFPNELECVCSTWAGELIPFRGPHHVNCKWHGKDELAEAKQVIRYLLCAMRNWAGDEDGVHPDAVLAYDRAALFVGEEKLKVEE